MSSLSIATRSGTTKSISTDLIDKFRAEMRGELIAPADDQFESSRKIWNGMIDKKPVLIARCAGAEDVINAVKFSKEHNLVFSIRGGGHNVAGTAIAEGGLVIDLSAMRNVTVDPEQRIARAEGGVRLGDLDCSVYIGAHLKYRRCPKNIMAPQLSFCWVVTPVPLRRARR